MGRDLRRTVLVDDTPLAFLHQPDNGVPVLGFRGDPDDRLLCEAVLPLMQVCGRAVCVGICCEVWHEGAGASHCVHVLIRSRIDW